MKEVIFLDEEIILSNNFAAVCLVLFECGVFWYMKLHHAFVEHTTFIIYRTVFSQ